MQSRSLASVPQHSPASHCSSGTLLGTSVADRSQRSVRQVIRCYEFKGLAISRADARKVYERLHFVGQSWALLQLSALRVSRDGCEVVHPLNSRSQYPEMEQIASFARYSVREGTTVSG